MNLVEKFVPVIRVIVAVVFLMGFHCICHSINPYEPDMLAKISVEKYREEIDKPNALSEIEELLRMHDLYKYDKHNPDSAIVYVIPALNLAYVAFGYESKEYVEIFTDYFLPFCDNNRKLICQYVYPLITETFLSTTPGVNRTYYKLGKIMESFDEDDKAIHLYQQARMISKSNPIGVKSAIRMEVLRQKSEGGSLEDNLKYITEDLSKIGYSERADVLLMLAIELTRYFRSVGDDTNALRYIKNGERLYGHVPSWKFLPLLRLKYEILVNYDHKAATDCLEDLISHMGNYDNEDIDYLAMAYIDRGDYELTELMNVDEAWTDYMKAYHLIEPTFIPDNPVVKSLSHRFVRLLTDGGQYKEASVLGENLMAHVDRSSYTEGDWLTMSELLNTYVSAGDIDKATSLMSDHKALWEMFPSMAPKKNLLEAQLELIKGDYQEAAKILETLLEGDIHRCYRLWGERDLAKAYTNLGDPRMIEMSDKVNITAKRIVESQILLISPQQRRNWFIFCDEAIKFQLSLAGNERAERNAAELNLFKKSLLFRTRREIERLIKSDPEAGKRLADLDSLRRQRQLAITKGDIIKGSELYRQIDESEQHLASKLIDRNSMRRVLDISLDDVDRAIGNDKIALDFITERFRGVCKIGAFVHTPGRSPQFVALVEYTDSMPPEIITTIWEKLKPYTEGYSDIYFCPDGDINNLPLEYYYPSDEKPGCNRVSCHRVFHLSDIHPELHMGDNIVFIGVSDYNSKPTADNETIRGDWLDLPNVEEELNSLKRCFPGTIKVLHNGTATENTVKQLDKTDVTTLHISAHGVFRDHKSLEKSSSDPTSDDHFMACHILDMEEESLSALILHGGNKSWNEGVPDDQEDNLLLSGEIELMSFPNLNLTVLSACETGLGEIDSEGVWGLQRAFRIAGTKNLICSLSKVDDYWTAQFMDAFYQQAAAGNTIYDSFHTAQRWLRRELPDNPEIWSSFILIE